jgi:hypothetical protein
MVNGNFTVESAPGKGTTILAQVLLGKARAWGAKNPLMEFARSNLESL